LSSRASVCHLLYSLEMGGAEVLATRLGRHFAGRFRTLFVCLRNVGVLGEQLRRDGFPVYGLDRRPGMDWNCALQLARVLRTERVALVHAHQIPAFVYGSIARLLAPRPPILFTEHGLTHARTHRRKRMLTNRLLLQRRDRVVAVGQAVRRALIDHEGFPGSRVRVIYNGIPDAPFLQGAGTRAAVREELGLAPDSFVLFQVGRLDPIKDHATALRALERVAARRPDVRLVLVGDGPEKGRLQELSDRHGLGPRVRFLGLRHDVPRLLACADLVLLSSTSEGIPLALIEAMAAGLPVASTDVGGVPEVVTHGATGLLAPAGDEGALAGAVLRLAGDAPLRRQMGERGRERARTTFSEDQMYAGYRALYEEMLRRA
jgi:sugar transferase (PEP-CTERM/EpsH1 system associated)